MANISSIKLPDGFIYDIKDNSKSTATNWLNGSQTGSLRTIGSVVGISTKANGNYSHAQNFSTIAQRRSQTAIGEYNIADTSGADGTELGDYAFIIGNGTDANSRSNALTIDWNGDVRFGNPSNGKEARIGIGIDATYMDIGWDRNNSDGAILALHSVDYVGSSKGAFALVARDETQSSSLSGYPNGTLTWGGTNVSLQGHSHTNPLQHPAQKTISFKATAANAWQYTGLSFTIPSGHQYLVRPWMGWNSGKPTGVGFETSTSTGTKGFPTYSFENANGFCTPPIFLLPPGTFYLFEKRATTPTAANTDYISFIDIVFETPIT